MLATGQIFSTDLGKITDFSKLTAADIFNRAVLPAFDSVASLLRPQPESLPQPQAAASPVNVFQPPKQNPFLVGAQQTTPQPEQGVDYNAPIEQAPAAPAEGGFKLSNYGYSSDSSPDYNSNVARIGHANNKLEDGVSAALSKSLAQRYGLKTGDYFEVKTADGQTLRRRYDDTVPAKYKGKPLPETVDLFELGGSNNFGGTVTEIRPLNSQ